MRGLRDIFYGNQRVNGILSFLQGTIATKQASRTLNDGSFDKYTRNFIIQTKRKAGSYLAVNRTIDPDIVHCRWFICLDLESLYCYIVPCSGIMLLLLIRVFLILTLRIGAIEQYHPRQQLQWQLFRILMLYMLNLYTLIFALFGKVRKMVRPTKYRQRQRNYTSLKSQWVFISIIDYFIKKL